MLRQRVKVRMEDNPETVSVFANTDIAVLRSGKARKNDPPIPADYAPISGSGRRMRKTEPEADKPLLEPIRFRYSTEAVVEEPEQKEPREGKPTEAPRSRSRRSRRSNADAQAKQTPQAQEPAEEKPQKAAPAEKPQKTQAPENPQKTAAPEKPANRRRRRRGPKPGGSAETKQ